MSVSTRAHVPTVGPNRRAVRALRTAVALTALALSVTALSGPATAAPDDGHPRGTTLHPAKLERGRATDLVHTRRKTIVDGDVRIHVEQAERMFLLGRSGPAYVVVVHDRDFQRWWVLRVMRDGDTRRVVSGGRFFPDPVLSEGGAQVALTRYHDGKTRIKVVDTRTGEVVRARTFGRTLEVADFARRRLVISEQRRGHAATWWWNPQTNRRHTIARLPAYIADVRADRLGLVTRDDASGLCQKVVRLSDPDTTLWRSCRDRALSFSPHGRRMATTYILSDGPGPRLVQVRGSHGRVQHTYRSQWFGFIAWESDRAVLLQTGGGKYTAAVRCRVSGACQRASKAFRNRGAYPWDADVMRWSVAP